MISPEFIAALFLVALLLFGLKYVDRIRAMPRLVLSGLEKIIC